MNELRKRSVLKSFIWRIVGVIILAIVTFFYTRQWVHTTAIVFIHHSIFFIVFYIHERFYQYVMLTGLTRSIIKAITYETILGNFILGIISLAVTGDVQQMTQITLTYIGIKHLIFVFNEFLWEKIKWGIVHKQ